MGLVRYKSMQNKKPEPEDIKDQLTRERYELLQRIQNFLEGPMVILGFVWLVLLVVELLWDLNDTLLWLNYAIWGIFIFDFLKGRFLYTLQDNCPRGANTSIIDHLSTHGSTKRFYFIFFFINQCIFFYAGNAVGRYMISQDFDLVYR